MSSPPGEKKNARIVTTTLLLTEHITREDRGSEGNYLLYGSSCAQITEEAEYVRKQLPEIPGNKAESKSSTSGSSYSPVVAKMQETEQQLLLVSKENQVLKIKLEATREAGVQALRCASQKLSENYHARSEELRKRHEKEKQHIESYNVAREQKLQQSTEDARRLAAGLAEKCARVSEMEQRVQRMEEEKKTLMERKLSLEQMLLRMMAKEEDSKRRFALQQEISTLQEQIGHLQRLIRVQHQDLRSVIQEVEELNNELRNQDKKIGDLTEKLNALEAQNKELKEKVEFWSGQSTRKVSKGVATDTPRGFATSPYVMLTRLRKQES